MQFQHILHGIFSEGDLPERLDELCAALRTRTGLSAEQLDFTRGSLTKLSQALDGRAVPDELDGPLVRETTAYFGEVLRRIVDGRWTVRHPWGHPTVWEPWITSSWGDAPVGQVVADMLNDGQTDFADLMAFLIGNQA